MRLIVCSVLLCALAGCSLSGERVTGQVIDQNSGLPISGAMVFASWQGILTGGVITQSTCFHQGLALTDEKGTFNMPPWTNHSAGIWQSLRIADRSMSIGVYAAGYMTLPASPENASSGVYKVKRDRRNANERFQELSNIGDFQCSLYDGESAKNLKMLMEATLKEARPLATTPDNYRVLDMWKDQISHIGG
jgi:hypothetical protein